MYRTIEGIPVWGDPLQNAVDQIKNCRKDAAAVALMADHHQGYAVPIGGVVAYNDKVSPYGVGYDIACGNKAVLTDLAGEELRKNIEAIMDDVWRTISFGVGRRNPEPVEHPLFDDDPAWSLPVVRELKKMARDQLGTVGSGNHYVDLFTDEQDRVWIGVHFGSRGLGHRLATHFIKAGGGREGINVDPVLLDVGSGLGEDYLASMELAGRYAYAGRDWVCSRVGDLLGARILTEVHNHHNFSWKERHEGADLWVVRKGATPAWPGQTGFIGASMGEPAVIIEGVESEESKAALYSTVHGAGRVMSRTEARGKSRWKKQKEKPGGGKVTPEMMQDWVKSAGVTLRGADVDESPHCYKRLQDVLACHEGTIRVLHVLKPVGVAMAGEGEVDPYKD